MEKRGGAILCIFHGLFLRGPQLLVGGWAGRAAFQQPGHLHSPGPNPSCHQFSDGEAEAQRWENT